MSLMVVDLSNNNGVVDFARLSKLPGLVGVMLKATEGVTFTDKYFAGWRREAQRDGLRVGAYHFAHVGNGPEAEARHFCSVVSSLGRRDLRPCLDAETNAGPAWINWTRRFNSVVVDRLGVGPLFYSYPAWIEALGASKPLGYGLWLASFGRNDGREYEYRVPRPWRKAVMHQFTSNARVPGVSGPCDLSAAPKLAPLLAHPWIGRL